MRRAEVVEKSYFFVVPLPHRALVSPGVAPGLQFLLILATEPLDMSEVSDQA
ncbi:MAG: hypothetical protein PF904_15275 [Kiritimatiellae bacterium]|nr:hypothetical protein [Kiritimatiellia bacterium]